MIPNHLPKDYKLIAHRRPENEFPHPLPQSSYLAVHTPVELGDDKASSKISADLLGAYRNP